MPIRGMLVLLWSPWWMENVEKLCSTWKVSVIYGAEEMGCVGGLVFATHRQPHISGTSVLCYGYRRALIITADWWDWFGWGLTVFLLFFTVTWKSMTSSKQLSTPKHTLKKVSNCYHVKYSSLEIWRCWESINLAQGDECIELTLVIMPPTYGELCPIYVFGKWIGAYGNYTKEVS